MAKRTPALKRKLKNKVARGGKNKKKTKRAAAKRYKVLGSGKVKVGRSNKQHNTGKKRRKTKNRLRKGKIVRAESMSNVKKCLPNSF